MGEALEDVGIRLDRPELEPLPHHFLCAIGQITYSLRSYFFINKRVIL